MPQRAPFLHLQALRAVLDGVALHPASVVDSGLARSVFSQPVLTTGALLWPLQHAHRVLHEWVRWTRTMPADVTSVGRVVRYPRLPAVPLDLAGRALVAVEVAIPGEPWVADGRLAMLRALEPQIDTVVLATPRDVPAMHLGLDLPARATGRHLPLESLTGRTVDAFLAAVGSSSGSNLVSAELRHLGVAYSASAAGRAADEEDASRLALRFDLLAGALAPFATGPAERVGAEHVRMR